MGRREGKGHWFLVLPSPSALPGRGVSPSIPPTIQRVKWLTRCADDVSESMGAFGQRLRAQPLALGMAFFLLQLAGWREVYGIFCRT